MEVKNKKDMLEFLEEKGSLVELHKRFGCYSLNLYPFEKLYSTEEQEMIDFIQNEDKDDCDELAIRKDELESITRANISTVFNRYRYYFRTHEQLRTFCEIVEKD